MIFDGKNYSYINSAEEKASFHSVSNDIEKMSLAFYFAELVLTLNPTEGESEQFLRLFLNSLHLLSTGDRDKKLIKAVFELKASEYCGFMPNITACASCGKYDDSFFYFNVKRSELLCKSCKTPGCFKLSSKSLMALRFVYLNEIEKVFNFTVDEESLNLLALSAEEYIKAQTGERFKTLEFYNSLIKG